VQWPSLRRGTQELIPSLISSTDYKYYNIILDFISELLCFFLHRPEL
jgi:hypothetical protein